MWQISMQYPAPGFKLTTFWSPPLITRPEADPLKILKLKFEATFFKAFWLALQKFQPIRMLKKFA